MKTVVIGPNPDVEAIIARRQALGLDRYDEVWEGEYHLTPGPSGPHAVLDHSLALFLGPRAKAAGLVGTSAFNLGQPNATAYPTAATTWRHIMPGSSARATVVVVVGLSIRTPPWEAGARTREHRVPRPSPDVTTVRGSTWLSAGQIIPRDFSIWTRRMFCCASST